ncbi:MAG: hypothetical protein KAG61_12530 [Bacteriovoracaceae bacterium]|nr:hypothetical protein [Bacteriovoracaceae bacterium]
MKKLWTLTLLVTGLITGMCMAESYSPPNIEFNTSGPMQSNTAKVGDNWSKGMEYKVLEMPIIVREIASEKKVPATRNPASHSGRKIQRIKFVPAPWKYTR